MSDELKQFLRENDEIVQLGNYVTLLNSAVNKLGWGTYIELCDTLHECGLLQESKIWNGAQLRFDKVSNVVIPHGTKEINEDMFVGSSIISVEIPTSIELIHDNCFGFCSRLNSISYMGTVEQWRAITFVSHGWKKNNLEVTCTDGTTTFI